jgi:UDP-N-acetylmuramoyl-L-alanyl-D-glutamate--2,6-diaminopimelate ligase
MECSSQAIHQKRTLDLEFAGAIFTNLTHDHLDYHKTIEAYVDAKKELFDRLPENAFSLVNNDDQYGAHMLRDTKAKKYSFGITNKKVDFLGEITYQSLDGTTLVINKKELRMKLTGKFNAYNILGIFAATKLLGVDEDVIISILADIDPPAGRLEFIKSSNNIYGIVDYAHTPDALENVLRTTQEIKGVSSKIITVVGCGGDRDKTKRPVMGNIACTLSDFAIFTSDNPRSENPESILKDIIAEFPENVKNYICIADRGEAIQKAWAMAAPGDIILLAGKGHETYQVFANETTHFSDMEELKKYLKI